MKKTTTMIDTPRLAPAMHAHASEAYLFDAASWQVLDANRAACAHLHYRLSELQAMTVRQLAPQWPAGEVIPEDGVGAHAIVQARLQRSDTGVHAVRLRLTRTEHRGRALILAMEDAMRTPQATAAALAQVQSRFNAIVSNTPGLVYQFSLAADGRAGFPYLSDGCQALLGLSPKQLHAQPELFYQLILAEDRASYRDSMLASKNALWSWNWEGRIWVDAWKDVKWINLRSTPRALANGAVQWEGIMTNITESRLEQIEVRQSRARLAELTAHIDKVKEQERTRLARELHDDLGGNLTAIKMALAMLARRLPEGDVLLQEKAAYVDDLVDRSIDAVHRISLDLRPSMLDLGLVAALDWQVSEFARQAGIGCVFSSNRKEIDLSLDQATTLFRIAQEALTNIAKHARASAVTVRLDKQRQHIRLCISDNGVGMRPLDRAKPQSFGIRGMSERASALGGSLQLADAPGGGTVLTIKIRLTTPREAIIAAAASATTQHGARQPDVSEP
ncbi:sensor histidine kinase [Janthinobacterium psychrotolerans]|uniref:Histidine kinase-, DNA gyrase B-, and HSP90-like ATPase n=1 Tax=Janthinobacterium psychrotolerans TaxID=1747903 RepID=A0A1A7C747_9BURK|nr:sensor histidine kinase [Janthinobacterium psychrotolerans]OBV40590.1 Histidine kinase-, DNA gyrase B-, and HSP90-like ATPase [Janthinobacterium psychrotolerans]